jgi:hypothetical protein
VSELLAANPDDALRTYWDNQRVRDWFHHNIHAEVTEPGSDAASKAWLVREVLTSKRTITAQHQASRSAQRREEEYRQELEAARAEVARLRGELAQQNDLCGQALESFAELWENVDPAREVLAAVLADPDGMPDVPEEERPGVRGILQEVIGLIGIEPSRRRFSDKVYKLAFTLPKHSRAGYEVLRRTGLPLPSRQAILERFREAMDEQEEQITATAVPEEIAARVFRHCCQHGVDDPSGLPVIVTSDATGMSDTGVTLGSGYVFAIGVLFTDPQTPDLWVHVGQSPTGRHRDAEPDELAVADACEMVGLRVLAFATDGDRDTDRRHTASWGRYGQFDDDVSLRDIVHWLLQNGGIDRRPASDLLHLLKNLRQRVRNHNLAWDGESPMFTGVELNELFGGGAVATTGQSGSMNDGLALELFDIGFVRQCWEIGATEAVRFLLPWALLAAYVRGVRTGL